MVFSLYISAILAVKYNNQLKTWGKTLENCGLKCGENVKIFAKNIIT
jgi:hypothetical protein